MTTVTEHASDLRRAPNAWGLVVAAGLSIFMAQLDTTIVHVALPSIETELGTRTAVTQWVILGYLIPLVALMLLSGRWLDTVGHRSALTAAAGGFAVASVAAGLSPGVEWLILARIVQGGFGAVLLALAPVLAVHAVRPEMRARALAVVSVLAPLGAMSGPLLGGLFVDSLGWPWIFYVNVPVAAVVVGLGRALLPHTGGFQLPQRSWMVEVLLLGGAAVALLLGLSMAAERHLLWLGLAVAAPPLLMVWRRTAVSVPVRGLLALPGMKGPHVAFISAYAALLLVQFLSPFYLQRVLGASAVATGVTLLTLPAATAAVGPVSGYLSDRIGTRIVALAGAVVGAVGVLLLLPLAATWGQAELAWRLAVVGVGFGLFVTPNMTMVMAAAPTPMHGLASATSNLARLLGLALGPALGTTAWALSGYAPQGMRAGIGIAAVASVVTIAVVALSPAPRPTPDPEPTYVLDKEGE